MGLQRVLLFCAFVGAMGNKMLTLEPKSSTAMFDPFGQTDAYDAKKLPPYVVYDDATKPALSKAYSPKKPTVVIPRDMYMVAFNLWDVPTTGKYDTAKLEAGKVGDVIVNATRTDSNVRAKLSISSGGAKSSDSPTFEIYFARCNKGSAKFTVTVKSINVRFSFIKNCTAANIQDIVVLGGDDQTIARGGYIAKQFNAHTKAGTMYVAYTNIDREVLRLRALRRSYTVRNITVKAYEATDSFVKYVELSKKTAAQKLAKPKGIGFKGYTMGSDSINMTQKEFLVFATKDAANMKKALPNPKAVPSNVCVPQISGEMSALPFEMKSAMSYALNSKVVPGILKGFAAKATSRLDIQYNCVNNGKAIIEVVFYIDFQSKDQGVISKELKLSWVKVCGGEKDPSDFDESLDVIRGFDIRLGAYIPGDNEFFAVRDGVVTSAFKAHEHALTISPEEHDTSFYVYIDPIVALKSTFQGNVTVLSSFVSSSTEACTPYVTGHGAHGAVVGIQPLPIVVHYGCSSSGGGVISLIMEVEVATANDIRMKRLVFSWQKLSTIVGISALNIRTTRPEPFMDPYSIDMSESGQSIHASPVVTHGVVTQQFSPAGFTYQLSEKQDLLALKLTSIRPNRKAVKGYYNKRFQHMMSMKALEIEQPTIVSSSTICHVSIRNIADMEALAAGALEPEPVNEKMFYVTKKSPVYLVVDHECVGSGLATITLTVAIPGRAKKVDISWGKACHWENTQVSVHAAAGGAVAAFFFAVVCSSALCAFRYKKELQELVHLRRRAGKNGFDFMPVKTSQD